MSVSFRFVPSDWRVGVYVERGFMWYERFHIVLQVPMMRVTLSSYRERETREHGGTAGFVAPSPEAEEFIRRAESNPAFNAMIERLADE